MYPLLYQLRCQSNQICFGEFEDVFVANEAGVGFLKAALYFSKIKYDTLPWLVAYFHNVQIFFGCLYAFFVSLYLFGGGAIKPRLLLKIPIFYYRLLSTNS